MWTVRSFARRLRSSSRIATPLAKWPRSTTNGEPSQAVKRSPAF